MKRGVSTNKARGNVDEHNLGFARLDLARHQRCGVPEVIYCAGKAPAQVSHIIAALTKMGHNVFGTRCPPEMFTALRQQHPRLVYHETARAITLDIQPLPKPLGHVAVICAGTSDLPVAEEAALTAERMGAAVVRIHDVGVAGLHRLMRHLPVLRKCNAIVAVAGMEGALPSVVGGLIDRPLIAVPTSVGYGMNLQGVATLLAMLNSCVSGVTVVNVDNGFGAGVAAATINRLVAQQKKSRNTRKTAK
ncbi:MAG: nickel pincer cofactor biosynthesis protein LarB [Verrucomicrobia bacterium]|nr:MAG: nickel pincer cofactor biosynthesis protein LarB [Verrucomicrobiota bacterium]